MYCLYPKEIEVRKKDHFVGPTMMVPCRRCRNCRVQAREHWTMRLLLEQKDHDANMVMFVTLTYDDDHLPVNLDTGSSTVVKDHVQRWIKRYRYYCRKWHIESPRYYICGEYGDKTGRPHYHAILYGHPYQTVYLLLELTWSYGHWSIYPANDQRIRYVCQYVTKKLMGKGMMYLDGRSNEFALMSRRPGLGQKALRRIVDSLDGADRQEYWETGIIRINGHKYTLDAYARDIVLDPDDCDEAKAQRMRDTYDKYDKSPKWYKSQRKHARITGKMESPTVTKGAKL